MIRLYLIRLAANEKRAGVHVLTGRGKRRFRCAARAFAHLEEPIDLICTSGKRHARQTADILARALDRNDVVELDELSRPGSTASLLRTLAARAGDGDGVALVGGKRRLRELLGALGLGKRELPLRRGSVLRIDVDALPHPRACIARFRLRPAAGELEDAFVGLRKVG